MTLVGYLGLNNTNPLLKKRLRVRNKKNKYLYIWQNKIILYFRD